jgi:hypothetical protein
METPFLPARPARRRSRYGSTSDMHNKAMADYLGWRQQKRPPRSLPAAEQPEFAGPYAGTFCARHIQPNIPVVVRVAAAVVIGAGRNREPAKPIASR